MSNVMFRTIEEAMIEEASENEDGTKPAISIAVIMELMKFLGPIIANRFCNNAKAAMKDGGDQAMLAAWEAIHASGYPGDRGSLMLRLVGKAKAASDKDLDEVIQTCSMYRGR